MRHPLSPAEAQSLNERLHAARCARNAVEALARSMARELGAEEAGKAHIRELINSDYLTIETVIERLDASEG